MDDARRLPRLQPGDLLVGKPCTYCRQALRAGEVPALVEGLLLAHWQCWQDIGQLHVLLDDMSRHGQTVHVTSDTVRELVEHTGRTWDDLRGDLERQGVKVMVTDNPESTPDDPLVRVASTTKNFPDDLEMACERCRRKLFVRPHGPIATARLYCPSCARASLEEESKKKDSGA